VNVTNSPDVNEDYAAWSPDGRLLAYSGVDAGIEKVFIRAYDDVNAPAQVFRRGRMPFWSPDGSALVFAVDTPQTTQFVVEAYSGSGVATSLTAINLPAGRPVWTELTPNVALRAVVQDGVLPTVAMAVGPGEAGYLAQLREVFQGLGVRPACAVPRFAATWLPEAARELLEASGADTGSLITSTDAVIRRHAESLVPDDVRAILERTQADTLDALDAIAGRVKEVDASLPQMVGSARGKIDYQFQRLHEGVVGKVRHQLERQHAEWLRLRYYLMPGDKPQERRLASLEPIAHRGLEAVRTMAVLAEAHAAALEEGRLENMVVDL
jgi:hypothetical protein